MKAILAMTHDGLIGNKGGLPWNIPEELKLFKKLTKGTKVVMGRKTAESLGKPLKGRENFVLTRDDGFNMEGFQTITEREVSVMDGDVFIIGGSSVYEKFIPMCESVIISHIRGCYTGDAHVEFKTDFNERVLVMKHKDFETFEYKLK